ncbi:MAG: radical SAM protein [Desulfobacterales bacterium]
MTRSVSDSRPAYEGFEQGPIRPPSEAYSLLIRVTRNCPWNRCRFCPVYKGSRFSLRPVDHVLRDIDAVHRYVQALRSSAGERKTLSREDLRAVGEQIVPADNGAFHAALQWFAGGMASIFLQDANSLILPPQELIRVLQHLKLRFPWVERITSYARSHTVARISGEDLSKMAAAGLNRIHIGMESGSDAVLERMKKGVTQSGHIQAGLKIKTAGMELSEYVMPGLGGRELSREHALDTAEALNRINPDFIRMRTLAIRNHTELAEDRDSGRFEKLTDAETADEILRFLDRLDGIDSEVKSDHLLNLFQEVEGRLPGDAERMKEPIRRFLDLPGEERMLYQVGRRMGYFHSLADMASSSRRAQAEQACRTWGITPENVDEKIEEIMKRFI